MSASTVLPSHDALTYVRSAWPGRGWSWDARSNSVVSSFSASVEDEYRVVITHAFVDKWDRQNIETAPPPIQRSAAATGGLRRGQLMYTPKNTIGNFAFALWWPWGDEVTVSARLLLSIGSYTSELALREMFGVAD